MYQSFAKVRRKLQTAKRFSVFFNGMNRNILSCDKLKTKNRFSRDREHEEQVPTRTDEHFLQYGVCVNLEDYSALGASSASAAGASATVSSAAASTAGAASSAFTALRERRVAFFFVPAVFAISGSKSTSSMKQI